MAIIPKNYARLESGYREKALKIYPWVCGRCSREFVYSNLRELTVHHIDHDHTNNPEDGSYLQTFEFGKKNSRDFSVIIYHVIVIS